MRPRILILAALAAAFFAGHAAAQDEVFVRGKPKPYKGNIKSESTRGLIVAGVKDMVPAEDVIDVNYEVNPILVRTGMYRPALLAEADYNDPDPKKEAKRKAKLGEALTKYGEALANVKEPAAKRHIEFKLALLTMRQALDDSGDLGPAMKRFTDFKTKHPNSWQITQVLQTLGKLQLDAKKHKEAEATYLELAAADVPELTKQEAELTAYQVGIRAGKHEESLKKLKALEAKLPKGSKYQGLARIAQAECLSAANKDSEAIALLRSVTKETADKNLKAVAYNTLGESFYNKEALKEARWEFLWVDVVYNQDKSEHAKALYYLWKTFDKLDEKDRAQECLDALISDRAFLGMEWQRRAAKESQAK